MEERVISTMPDHLLSKKQDNYSNLCSLWLDSTLKFHSYSKIPM